MIKHRTCCIVTLALLILFPMTALAQSDAALIKDMPDPARVLADIKGPDSAETSGRQNAALTQLSRVIDELKSGGTLTPELQKVRDAYDAALSAFRPPGGEQYKKFHDTYYRYEKDETFRDELLARYFSADWQKHYRELRNARQNPTPPPPPAAAERDLTKLRGLFPLSAMFALIYWTNKREWDGPDYSSTYAKYSLSRARNLLIALICIVLFFSSMRMFFH
jgi:hypothetical protein